MGGAGARPYRRGRAAEDPLHTAVPLFREVGKRVPHLGPVKTGTAVSICIRSPVGRHQAAVNYDAVHSDTATRRRSLTALGTGDPRVGCVCALQAPSLLRLTTRYAASRTQVTSTV